MLLSVVLNRVARLHAGIHKRKHGAVTRLKLNVVGQFTFARDLGSLLRPVSGDFHEKLGKNCYWNGLQTPSFGYYAT